MRYSLPSTGGLMLLLPLATMFCLGGCSLTLGTSIGAIDAAVVTRVCTAWAPVTYSSKDTPQTQIEVRGNNAARVGFGCPEQ
jgi:hypothetical protein